MKFSYVDRRLQLVKSFYMGIGKSALIFPIAFLAAFGQGLVTLGVIFYIRDIFGATPSQVGTMTGLWSAAYITGCIFLRRVTDGILPRHLLIAAAFLECLFVALILTAGNFTVVIVLYMLFGMSISLFWPPIMGWLSQDIEGPALGRLMARFNLSWSVGSIVSPQLAGLLSERYESLPLIAGCCLFFLAGILVLLASLTLPKIRSDRMVNVKKNAGGNGTDGSTPLRFPAWIGVLTTYTTIGVIVNIFPLYALNTLEFSKSTVGFIMQNRALFGMVGFLIMGRTTFWHFRPGQMIIGQLIYASLAFSMMFADTGLATSALISSVGIFMAQSYFNSMFHGVSGSINRAGRMAVHEVLISSGLIIGSVFGGIIYQRFSMEYVYIFCAAFVLLGVVLQGAILIGIRKKNASV